MKFYELTGDFADMYDRFEEIDRPQALIRIKPTPESVVVDNQERTDS